MQTNRLLAAHNETLLRAKALALTQHRSEKFLLVFMLG
jgi:hypothetical protein